MDDPCPNADHLWAFAQGHLTAEEVRTVEIHVAGCPTCPEVLALLTNAHSVRAPGDLVDRYRILDRVGQGAFGMVYAAYDPKLDRKVALKILPRSSPEAESRILREARAMAKVASPYVVPIHDVGTVDDSVYAAMEFVEGETLRSWLRNGPRTPAAVLDAFVQAGRGLASAHAAGIVHRDFKPENVLVSQDGRVAVADFGLASETPRASQAVTPGTHSTLAGTPPYMAPEVLRGGRAEPRSDIYAFSVALYEALYGNLPFDAADLPGLEQAWARGPLSPTRSVRVPTSVHDLILRGLSADPAHRPASMVAVVEGLQPARRRRRAAALLGVGAVALAVWWLRPGPPRIEACDGPVVQWDAVRRSAVERGLLATGHPSAADTWSRTSVLLDRYAARWSEQWSAACAAPVDDRVRAWVQCLTERLERFDLLVDQLAAADRQTMDFAGTAAYGLPSVEVCAGSVRAEALPGVASDPVRRQIRQTIDRARTQHDLGHTQQALDLLPAALERARSLPDRAVEAEILLTQGDLLRTGTPEDSVATLHAAAAAAAAAGRLDLEAQAKVLLVQALTGTTAGPEASATELAYAEALVGRLDDPVLSAELLNARARVNAHVHQRPDLALPDSERYLTAVRELNGEAHPKVASALAELAQNYLDLARESDALRAQREALDLRVRLQGPDHPGAIGARANFAYALYDLGQIEEAIALTEDNLARVARTLAPDDAVAQQARHSAAVVLHDGGCRSLDALELILPASDFDERESVIQRYGASVWILTEVGTRETLSRVDGLTMRLLRIAEQRHEETQSSYWSALELRALALTALGRCTEALSYWDRAIALIDADPSGANSSAWAREQRTPCLVRARRIAEAERDLRDGLRDLEESNTPGSPWVVDGLLPLASFLNDTGHPEEARVLAERALQSWPGRVGKKAARAHYEVGRSWRATDPTTARAAFERARLALGPGLGQCRLGDDVLRALGEPPRPRAMSEKLAAALKPR